MIIPNYNDGTIDIHLDPVLLGKCKKLASVFDKTDTDEEERWGGFGTYGGGVANTPEDRNNVERTGAAGEKAFSLLTGIPMNEKHETNGDQGFDFIIPSFSIDVKCHMRHPNQALEWGYYGEFFTRANTMNGSYLPPRADILVFSAIVSGDCIKSNCGDIWDQVVVDGKKADNLIVRFFGAISSKKIFLNYQERLGGRLQMGGPNSPSDFENYYIKREELLPMIDFMFQYKNELMTTKSGVII